MMSRVPAISRPGLRAVGRRFPTTSAATKNAASVVRLSHHAIGAFRIAVGSIAVSRKKVMLAAVTTTPEHKAERQHQTEPVASPTKTHQGASCDREGHQAAYDFEITVKEQVAGIGKIAEPRSQGKDCGAGG